MKRAVVTGGTRGIGLATVRLLMERGYLVTALYSSDEESAKNAKAECPNAEFVRADVSDEESVRRVFEGIPRLDVLILNAGISHFSQVQDERFEDFKRVMDVNMGGVFLCAKYAVPKLISFGGAIVCVSSVWGECGASCESSYSASKGAVISFSKALAKELAPANVTVNCVTPGVIDTSMNLQFSAEEIRALKEEIPLGRLGYPEEVAEAIVFLAEAHYITGQVLGINGGFHIA